MESTIIKEINGSVGIIRLNRPTKLNAFIREKALLFQDVLEEFATDAVIRCIYITGNGKGFSAGQDLEEIIADDGPTLAQILSEHYNPIIHKIRNIPKPVVAAVNGVAAGAGANIALACDIVIASENASFIQAFSKIGLIPDSGGTFFLPRLIGFQKASAIMMLGDKVSAIDAEKWGMIYKTLPADQFEEEALKIAHQLAAMPTKGLAHTKQALNQSMSNSLEEQLALEDKLQQTAATSKDHQEGVAAFLEKRAPNFTGQ
ncbi:enoyl-CoA hydratase-related protein [Gynurincola endophyticus]|uniref:enoyl-CoA hydratase-related protein n=1 Tax=Gynurincola endophyticus TaxID=2479004 RepID=UPI000F8EEB3E|nr:enoyl-CoA hydratase-related protein [Gynurincola endophyticus]